MLLSYFLLLRIPPGGHDEFFFNFGPCPVSFLFICPVPMPYSSAGPVPEPIYLPRLLCTSSYPAVYKEMAEPLRHVIVKLGYAGTSTAGSKFCPVIFQSYWAKLK